MCFITKHCTSKHRKNCHKKTRCRSSATAKHFTCKHRKIFHKMILVQFKRHRQAMHRKTQTSQGLSQDEQGADVCLHQSHCASTPHQQTPQELSQETKVQFKRHRQALYQQTTKRICITAKHLKLCHKVNDVHVHHHQTLQIYHKMISVHPSPLNTNHCKSCHAKHRKMCHKMNKEHVHHHHAL